MNSDPAAHKLLALSPLLTDRGLAIEAARAMRLKPEDVLDQVFPLPPTLRRAKEKRRRNVSFEDIE